MATLIGSLTLGILVGAVVLCWFAGWWSIAQYSAALRVAGLVALMVGAASLLGNQGWSAEGHEGAAALELAHARSRDQSDYYQDQRHSSTMLLVMAAVGLLVGGTGLVLPLLLG